MGFKFKNHRIDKKAADIQLLPFLPELTPILYG
jgi:hypothetical protein